MKKFTTIAAAMAMGFATMSLSAVTVVTKDSADSILRRTIIEQECTALAEIRLDTIYFKNYPRKQLIKKLDEEVAKANGNALVITKLDSVDNYKRGTKYRAMGRAYQCNSSTLNKLQK